MKWVIIGGGMQGCMILNHLVKKRKATVEDICIVDPYSHPLELWDQYTSRIEMSHLRSPVSHHIDISKKSLEKYATYHLDSTQQPLFKQPYDRPALSLFNKHALKTITEINIMKAWKKGYVKSLNKTKDGWKVLIEDVRGDDFIYAENVILAVGNTEKPNWPEWAKIEKKNGRNITHVFDSDYNSMTIESSLLICGGGLTAAHLAMKYATKFPGNVTLAMRNELKVRDFETDLNWLEDEKNKEFTNISSYEKRRNVIKEAKEKGSITDEFKRNLDIQIDLGNLTIIHTDDFSSLCESAKSIILATGFQSVPLGEYCLSTFVKEDLPLSPCGYPILDKNLRWAPNLYCLGGLAELELGPISRNIAGARRGAERVISSLS